MFDLPKTTVSGTESTVIAAGSLCPLSHSHVYEYLRSYKNVKVHQLKTNKALRAETETVTCKTMP